MASQFVNNNNQTMLWKIINNTPQMVQVFFNSVPGQKEKWFGQVIKHVYDELITTNKQMSLRDINKYAIDFMLSLLNEQLHPSQQTIQQPITVESQFELRRKEYENLIKKEPPKANFTEAIKDEPLLDINSSLDEYRKQREYDINSVMKIMPSPQQQPQTPLQQPLQQPPQTLKKLKQPISLTITESSEEISLPIEELESNPKKQVKWGENTEHEYGPYTTELETKIDKILDLLQSLNTRIVTLESVVLQQQPKQESI